MQGILYEEPTIWLFLLVTVIMGGWRAWLTGRAIAIDLAAALASWSFYMLVLGLAVRFIHFALFEARCCRCTTTSSTPIDPDGLRLCSAGATTAHAR